MHILILGASSQVGAALAKAFAPGNQLVLVGRQQARLEEAVRGCQQAGASRAIAIALDLNGDLAPLRTTLSSGPIDLVIDAASASSALRDSEITSRQFPELVTADVLSKTRLMDLVLSIQHKAPRMILISSVLARIRSPDRVVYSALKQLHEAYLQRLEIQHPELRLLVVYVGTVIDTQRPSEKPTRLAQTVLRAHQEGRRSVSFGLIGTLYYALFHLQPLVFYAVTRLQRSLRGRKSTPGN